MASVPTLIPTSAPTFEPTMPTAPTFTPTKVPTAPPTLLPTPSPTSSPTLAPTGAPSFAPTPRPSFAPTRFTFAPSNANDPLGSNGVANPGYIAAFSVGAVLVFAGLWFVWFVFWYMPWHDKAPLTCFEQPIDDHCSRGTVRRCRQYCDDECPSYLLGHVPPLSMRQAFVAHMTGVPQGEQDTMLDHGQPSSHGHELGHGPGHEHNRGHGHIPEHEHDDGHDDSRLEYSAHRSPRSNHTHRPLSVEDHADTALDLDRHPPVVPSVARVAVPPALPPPSTGTTSAAKPEGFLL